jgi:uracil-DNA glycosylase
MIFLKRVHPEWLAALSVVIPIIQEIEGSLKNSDFLPPADQVLRALEEPLSKIRVVIFGQDPYPTPDYAMGLSFSVSEDVKVLPKSLENIFIELAEDIGCERPSNGDLSRWAHQGVALINRVLTVPTGRSNGHLEIGWKEVTDGIARVLGERDVVAILWGNNARELAPYFRREMVLSSVHPSPLSAYKGFFGSRPFSRTNAILQSHDRAMINWCE